MIKYNFYRYKFGLILGLLSLVLIACGSENGDTTVRELINDVDVEEMSESQLEEDYVMGFVNTVNKYMETHKFVYDNLDDYKALENKVLEYTSYLKMNELESYGELGELTYDDYNGFVVATELAMDYYLKYTMNGDDMYLDMGFSHGESGVAEAKKALATFKNYGY